MDKERKFGNGIIDSFWEKLKSEKLELGSDIYRACEEAIGIGWLYFERYKSNSGLLSGLEEQDIERQIGEVVRINGDNPMFIEKFKNICNWMTTGLEPIPVARISRKLEDLRDKIREANGRTDLV